MIDILELLNRFIESNSTPDNLSKEWDGDDDPLLLFRWDNGTVLFLPCGYGEYNKVWDRFQEYWRTLV